MVEDGLYPEGEPSMEAIMTMGPDLAKNAFERIGSASPGMATAGHGNELRHISHITKSQFSGAGRTTMEP